MRSFVKGLVDETWDLAVWLQHCSDATEYDADIALDATAHLIGTFGKLIRRDEFGEPERCPRCESYKLAEDIQPSGEGFYEFTVCGACDWRSEPTYTSWSDHLEGADIKGYLEGPGLGLCDQLHHNQNESQKPTGLSRSEFNGDIRARQ